MVIAANSCYTFGLLAQLPEGLPSYTASHLALLRMDSPTNKTPELNFSMVWLWKEGYLVLRKGGHLVANMISYHPHLTSPSHPIMTWTMPLDRPTDRDTGQWLCHCHHTRCASLPFIIVFCILPLDCLHTGPRAISALLRGATPHLTGARQNMVPACPVHAWGTGDYGPCLGEGQQLTLCLTTASS